MIRKITSIIDIEESVKVLQASFGTVARQFNLTQENCPTNSAFITDAKLQEEWERGISMFGLFEKDKQIGFVALEKSSTDSLFYLEKLAVIPDYRHKNYGKELMDFACKFVKNENGKKISIGIINENLVLKEWYTRYGFVEKEIKVYSHLPFTVCMMEKEV